MEFTEREWKGEMSFVKQMSKKKGWKRWDDQNDEKHCGWKYQEENKEGC